ncbi:unnamed protein product, partial [marine sediment metagenome]
QLDLYPYGNTASRNMIVWKDMVYVAADDGNGITATLFSVDVRNPDDLTYVSRGAYGGHKSNELIVVDDILYDASWFAFLRIFDVSTPGYFSYVSSFSPADGASWKIDVANDRAYLIESTNTESHGLWIIDISNPSSPSLVSHVFTDARTMGGVAARGSYVYYGNSNHFEIANISDEDNPYIVSDINLGFMAGAYAGNINSVRLRGDYAYIGCEEGTGGLFVFDVSDPTNPVQSGNYTGNGARDMYLLGDYAFMAGLGATLNTVDISNPS